MPVFDVTSPDGTKYRVTAPEGATKEQALEKVKAQHQAVQSQPAAGAVSGPPGAAVSEKPQPATKQNRGAYKPDIAPKEAEQNVELSRASGTQEKMAKPYQTGQGRSVTPSPETSEKQALPKGRQIVYDMLQSDSERAKFLRNYYGDNIGRDNKGLYVGLPNGRKMYPTSDATSSVVSNIAPMIGGAIGAGVGAGSTGPAAIAGGIAGAGLGTAAGQGVNDAIVKSMGFYDRTMGEEAAGLGEAGLGGMIGEGVGRAIPEATLAGLRGGRRFLGVDPEKASAALGLAKEGNRVSPGSYIESPRLQRFVDVSRGLGHDPLAKSGAQFAEKQAGGMLERSGMSPEAAAAETQRLKTARPSIDPAGQELKSAATQDFAKQKSDVEKKVAEIRAEAQKQGAEPAQQLAADRKTAQDTVVKRQAEIQNTIDEGFRQIARDRVTNKPGPLAKDMADKVNALRERVSGTAASMYEAADQASGGKTIPIHVLDDAAEKFLADVPEDLRKSSPALIRTLSDLSSGHMTFGQMHYLRSQLRDLGYSDKLTPDFKRGGYKYLSGVVDDLIHSSENDPEIRAAAKQLDKADQFYAANMKQFRNKELQGIVDNVRDGLPMDARKVARTVISAGEKATLKRIQAIGGPKIAKRLASADMDNIIAEAKDPISGMIDAKKFYAEIVNREDGGMMTAVHGAEKAKQAMLLAQRLAARDQQIPLKGMTTDNFVRQLKLANQASDRLDALMKQDPMKIMDAAVSGGEKQVKDIMDDFAKRTSSSNDMLSFLRKPQLLAEKAANWILNNEQLLKEAVARYGENSKAITTLRQKALERMLAPVMQRGGAKSLTEGLMPLTETQQKLLFPRGMADDLQNIAKGLDMIYGKGSDMSAGLAAGYMKDRPLTKFLPAYYYRTLGADLVTHPRFVRMIAADLSDKSTFARGLMKLRSLMAHGARGTIQISGADKPENEGTPEGQSEIPAEDETPRSTASWRDYARKPVNNWSQYAR